MKIGIVSDGKFGDRAFEIIRKLVRSINSVSPAAGARVRKFTEDREKIFDPRITGG